MKRYIKSANSRELESNESLYTEGDQTQEFVLDLAEYIRSNCFYGIDDLDYHNRAYAEETWPNPCDASDSFVISILDPSVEVTWDGDSNDTLYVEFFTKINVDGLGTWTVPGSEVLSAIAENGSTWKAAQEIGHDLLVEHGRF